MRTELPVLKRCCFCVPLRYGLITWGYLKLIAAAIVSIAVTVALVHTVNLMRRYGSRHITDVVLMGIVLVLLLTEIALNTVFVVGGHKKNVKLLRIYYIYNLVLWGLSIVMVLAMVCLMVPSMGLERLMSYYGWVLAIDLASYFVNISMQSYFLLLLRSEIMKLNNNCQFQFSNIAAEGACTMKYEERLTDEENVIEDDCEKEACETKGVCQKNCLNNGTCHKNEAQN